MCGTTQANRVFPLFSFPPDGCTLEPRKFLTGAIKLLIVDDNSGVRHVIRSMASVIYEIRKGAAVPKRCLSIPLSGPTLRDERQPG
jgi:hypothetical protein